MKKVIFSILIILISLIKLNAQEIKSEIYKGTINGTSITLYLQAEEHPCFKDIIYNGMYKYNKKSNWLQLQITQNNTKFILVEFGFTGVLILHKTKKEFDGVWISPDSEKQFKVQLQKTKNTSKENKIYEDKFEIVNYENNDC